jgi:hypothetical protein
VSDPLTDTLSLVMNCYATLTAQPIEEVEATMRTNGDILVPSPQGEAILGNIEGRTNRILPNVAEMKDHVPLSVRSLAKLVERGLAETKPAST